MLAELLPRSAENNWKWTKLFEYAIKIFVTWHAARAHGADELPAAVLGPHDALHLGVEVAVGEADH